jgi:hypothetical protein
MLATSATLTSCVNESTGASENRSVALSDEQALRALLTWPAPERRDGHAYLSPRVGSWRNINVMKRLRRVLADWRVRRKARALHGAEGKRIEAEVRQRGAYLEGTNPPPWH